MSALPRRASWPLKDDYVDEITCATFGSRTLGDYRKPTWACTSPVHIHMLATSRTCTGRGEGAASVETAPQSLARGGYRAQRLLDLLPRSHHDVVDSMVRSGHL